MRGIMKSCLIIFLFSLLIGPTYYGNQGRSREDGVKSDYPYDVRFDFPDQHTGKQNVVRTEDHNGNVLEVTYKLQASQDDGDITYYMLRDQDQTLEIIVDSRNDLLSLLSHETSEHTFRDTIQWHLTF